MRLALAQVNPLIGDFEGNTAKICSHIDRAPMGDIAATIGMVLSANPDVDFTYTHRVDEQHLTLNTRELNSELGGRALSDPVVIHHLTVAIRRSLENLTTGTTNRSSPPAKST